MCVCVCIDMRWFGKAMPLIAMGKKTVKQPCHVSISPVDDYMQKTCA